jgi:hypothetical protein
MGDNGGVGSLIGGGNGRYRGYHNNIWFTWMG